ncbi:MAG: DKNYY domain-containing protein [Chitinophagaceae bacterium]
MVLKAAVATMVGLKKYYPKDKNHVYCEGRIVEGADIASFEEILPGYSEGMDKKETTNPESWFGQIKKILCETECRNGALT